MLKFENCNTSVQNGKIQIEVTVGSRRALRTDIFHEQVRKLLIDELRKLVDVKNITLAIDTKVDRYPITGSDTKEHRYIVVVHVKDVHQSALRIASSLRNKRGLLGNIVIRMNGGRVVLVAPCSKRSRQIRTHSHPISRAVVIVVDQSIELCDLDQDIPMLRAA